MCDPINRTTVSYYILFCKLLLKILSSQKIDLLSNKTSQKVLMKKNNLEFEILDSSYPSVKLYFVRSIPELEPFRLDRYRTGSTFRKFFLFLLQKDIFSITYMNFNQNSKSINMGLCFKTRGKQQSRSIFREIILSLDGRSPGQQ